MDEGATSAVITAVMEKTAQLRDKGKFGLVAIDGRSGSGKRSLASKLHDRLRWPVVHMDDFALRADEAHDAASGGLEIAYERLVREVLQPLKKRETVSFRTSNRRTGAERRRVIVGQAPFVIVEGTGSLHPKLRRHYDLKIFLDVDADEQLRRLKNTETPEAFESFRAVWIPQEEQYIREYDVRNAADLYYMT